MASILVEKETKREDISKEIKDFSFKCPYCNSEDAKLIIKAGGDENWFFPVVDLECNSCGINETVY